jgi:hypothetical protein
VLSGRGLWDGPIPRVEESFRLWCAIVCDLETWEWDGLGPSSTDAPGKKSRMCHLPFD